MLRRHGVFEEPPVGTREAEPAELSYSSGTCPEAYVTMTVLGPV